MTGSFDELAAAVAVPGFVACGTKRALSVGQRVAVTTCADIGASLPSQGWSASVTASSARFEPVGITLLDLGAER